MQIEVPISNIKHVRFLIHNGFASSDEETIRKLTEHGLNQLWVDHEERGFIGVDDTHKGKPRLTYVVPNDLGMLSRLYRLTTVYPVREGPLRTTAFLRGLETEGHQYLTGLGEYRTDHAFRFMVNHLPPYNGLERRL